LDVLYGGLVISKYKFLIKKFRCTFFSSTFGRQNSGSRLDPDPDPYLDSLECWIRIQ